MVPPVSNLPCRDKENQSVLMFCSTNMRCHDQVTFPHEVRNFEVHNGDRGVVDHVVLFHVVKLCIRYDLPLLLDGGGQAQKVAKFVHFAVSVLQNQTPGHTRSSETSVVDGDNNPTTLNKPLSCLRRTYSGGLNTSVFSSTSHSRGRTRIQTPLKNTAVHSYSSFILYLWYQMKVFPTYSFPPWICGGNCSILRLLAETYSCDQSGNRTRRCLWHYGPRKWSTRNKSIV